MTWLDHDGITHDGSPPEGRCRCGGRWYDIAEVDDKTGADFPVDALLSVAC